MDIAMEDRFSLYAIDGADAADFSFLLTPEAVQALQEERQTGALVLKYSSASNAKHIGAIAGRLTGDGEFEILSLYVLPEFRRKGAATRLLSNLESSFRDMAEEAQDEQGISLPDFVPEMIRFVRLTPEEEALAAFLDASGFSSFDIPETALFSLPLSMAKTGKLGQLLAKKKKGNPDIKAFSEIPSYVLKSFSERNIRGFVPLPDGGLVGKQVDKDLSFALIKEEQILGFAIVEHLKRSKEKPDYKTLVLSCAYLDKKAPPAALVGLLSRCLAAGCKRFALREETVRILIPAVTEGSRKLVELLLDLETAGDSGADLETGTEPETALAIQDIQANYRKQLPLQLYGFGRRTSLSNFLDQELWSLRGGPSSLDRKLHALEDLM